MKIRFLLKWHKFWSDYHYAGAEDALQFGSTESAFAHILSWLDHTDRYIELGGNPNDVYED